MKGLSFGYFLASWFAFIFLGGCSQNKETVGRQNKTVPTALAILLPPPSPGHINQTETKKEKEPLTMTGPDRPGLSAGGSPFPADVRPTPALACTDPALDAVVAGFRVTLCDGSPGYGTLDLANLRPENIRIGVAVGPVTGSLVAPAADRVVFGTPVGNGEVGSFKNRCRNPVDPGDFDNREGETAAGADTFDSTGEHACESEMWEQIVPVPAATAVGSDAIFCDLKTRQKWSRGNHAILVDWNDAADGDMNGDGAVEFCRDLDHGGVTNWRLPSQKELMQAYVNGITSLSGGRSPFDGDLGDFGENFWTSTSVGELSSMAFAASFPAGLFIGLEKASFGTLDSPHNTLCTAD